MSFLKQAKKNYMGRFIFSRGGWGSIKKLFVAFLGTNQFRRVGLRFVCWFYDGNTQRLTESGFMKPGIEPATPGLQGIALIHYTMGGFSYAKTIHNTSVATFNIMAITISLK